jgi:hypothetical protein
MTSETKSRPTHRVYAVIKSGDKKFWQPIGALWAHQDGQGFSQRLDYLPLNGAQIVIRSVDEDKAGSETPADGNGGAP